MKAALIISVFLLSLTSLLAEIQEPVVPSVKSSERSTKDSPNSRTTPPRAIYTPDPEYTVEARNKRIQGTVVLSITITASGRAENIRLKRSLYPGLDENAIEVMKKWKFQPAMKDGKPIDVNVGIEVNFRLKD